MPIYIFNIHHQGRIIQDNEGIDLPNDEAAEREALVALSEISKHNVVKGDRFHRVDVTDAARVPLFTATLTLKIDRLTE